MLSLSAEFIYSDLLELSYMHISGKGCKLGWAMCGSTRFGESEDLLLRVARAFWGLVIRFRLASSCYTEGRKGDLSNK